MRRVRHPTIRRSAYSVAQQNAVTHIISTEYDKERREGDDRIYIYFFCQS